MRASARTSKRGPTRRRTDASIPLPADGALRIAVIADTHSAPHPHAAALIADLAPQAILHAGDIGDLSVLAPFEQIAPLIAVRGNIDERVPHLPDVVTVDVQEGGECALRMTLMHIAVAGAKIRADAAREARERKSSLIVCGHSHVPFLGRDRGITVFNAGSIGPRRFRLPIVFGMLEIAEGRLHMRHVDCETGLTWTPGPVL